jgi:transcriptional regulator with PAS, ATPase and Fis domain
VSLQLRSGLRLFACNHEFGAEPASHRRRGTAAHEAKAAEAAEFGDDGIHRRIQESLRALDSGLPVLIQGETGSGKEVVAQALHRRSGHASGDFVAINCAAIPESLIEGELFGHAEGAYTGARRGGAPGRIELADGGTLFLDEIGDMPLNLQARLLRVLETREVSRLGAARSRRIDFQLICATHADIARAVAEGRFREDLFYRINGFVLTLMPLRARRGLLALAGTLLDEVSDGRRKLGASALELLQAHDWPGNVRELKHALTYAHAMAEPGLELEAVHFPVIAAGTASGKSEAAAAPRRAGRGAVTAEAVREALGQAEGDVTHAAKILGVGRATLYRRLREMKR